MVNAGGAVRVVFGDSMVDIDIGRIWLSLGSTV